MTKEVSNKNFRRKLDHKGVKTLGESLKRLSSLQSLHLGFGWCDNITDRGLNSLGEGLKGLNSLQHINMNFHG